MKTALADLNSCLDSKYHGDGIKEYLLFLVLKQIFKHENLSPPPLLEDVWRSHILRTKQYREFCLRIFGETVDYEPSDAQTDGY